MTASEKLVCIKVIHTVIWVFFNAVIFYLFYAVAANNMNTLAWICVSLILLEATVLLVFKNICPITMIARKYSASKKDNFDIYLPEWLARYNKQIYTTIVLISLAIFVYRLLD